MSDEEYTTWAREPLDAWSSQFITPLSYGDLVALSNVRLRQYTHCIVSYSHVRLQFSDFLDAQRLYGTCLKRIVELIKDKTPAQVLEMTGVGGGPITDDEEERARAEHPRLFKRVTTKPKAAQ